MADRPTRSASAYQANCPTWSRAARTVVVIHAEDPGEIARPACGALSAADCPWHAEPVPDGKVATTIVVVAGLWSRLTRHNVTRLDCAVGVG